MDLVEATLLIKKLLKRPVAYHRSFCEMTGKACAGVMLSQAWYWSSRTDDDDGWFYKTGKEWREETGLSRTEQETARKRLIALHLMDETERGMPCRMHFRVNIEAVVLQLVENPHTVSRQKIRTLVGQKAANLSAENPHTVLITEITQESTTENTLRRKVSQSKPERPNQKPKEPKIKCPTNILETCPEIREMFPEHNGSLEKIVIGWREFRLGQTRDTMRTEEQWYHDCLSWISRERVISRTGNGHNGANGKTNYSSQQGDRKSTGVGSGINTSLVGRIKRA